MRIMTQIPSDELLAGLDDAQRRAATCLDGPVRILAVAGAGKTRTITRRIAYGCATGKWNPRRTVAVTFTDKAAQEMQSRLRKLGAAEVTAATFHSLALSQLGRVWRDLVGGDMPILMAGPSSHGPAGQDPEAPDPLALVTDVVDSVSPAQSTSPREAQDVLSEIAWTKSELIPPEDYPAVCARTSRVPPAALDPKRMQSILLRYEQAKSERHAMDFDDILLILCHLIETSDEAAMMTRDTIGWLTVDEYQDVSPLEHRLVDLWLGAGSRAKSTASANRNICVVGDPAQTIYSFAGATSWYLLNFAREFAPLSADVKLTTDYRSVPAIVGCANRVLGRSPQARNYVRLHPADVATSAAAPAAATVLSAHASPGLRFVRFDTDEQEARAVARRIAELTAGGEPGDEIAVLTRTNAQLDPFRAAMEEAGIPYRMRRDGAVGAEKPTVPRSIREAIRRGSVSSLPAPVTLSTIHAAKGLEWNIVFVCGASDGLIPYSAAAGDEQIEEERRLLYVAVTRGRRRVLLSYALRKDAVSPLRRSSRFL